MSEETEDGKSDKRDAYDRLSDTQRQGIERERERDKPQPTTKAPVKKKKFKLIKPKDDGSGAA